MDELQDALDLVETALEELYEQENELEDKVYEADREHKVVKKEYDTVLEQINELETAQRSLKVALGK